MSKSKIKTNAMRILDLNNIEYNVHSYEAGKDHVDGTEVASKIGRDVKEVYKTLVAKGASKEFYVYVIPVSESLDLKKAARVTNEKNIEMINVKDINKVTGYIRGGCSPVGMKKPFPTWFHSTALLYAYIYVSAGVRGLQFRLSPKDIISYTRASVADIAVPMR